MYFIIILILVIIITILEKKLNEKEEKSENLINDYKSKYIKKEKLLTQNEILFFKVLNEIVKEKNIIVNTQVVLYEIIETRKNIKQFNANFNKIKSKSIDFVLTDNDFNIILCIELDDITHKKTDRIKRDNFINKLFTDLEINLLRIPVQNYYNLEKIKKIIEGVLK